MTAEQSRCRGALLGLAIGDAIGTTVEFKPRGTFKPLTDMVGGGPFNLKPGQWTDDTSMALCLAESLIDNPTGFDLRDQMRRYVRWAQEGYMSVNGRCFDIGIATSSALNRFRRTDEPLAGDLSPNNAGNGCLMRLAPVPIRYRDQPELAVSLSELQARGTHQAPECVAASRVFAELLVHALNGGDREGILAPPTLTANLPAKIHAIAVGQSYRKKARNAIRGTGYVVESLEAALWAFDSTRSFKDCVLAAANLGDDADTTAAIAGQLAGAFYGLEAIPWEWVETVAWRTRIVEMADNLMTARPAEIVDAEVA